VVLPLPLHWRNIFLEKLSVFWNNYPRARIVTKTFLGLVTLFFVDALRTLYITVNIVDPLNPLKTEELKMKMYGGQRNAFLTGFTLFMFIMLYRFETMLFDVINLERKVKGVNDKYEYEMKQLQQLREDVYLMEKTAQQHNLVLPPDPEIHEVDSSNDS